MDDDPEVTTIAGTGSSGSTNATGTSASFKSPEGITSDGTNLYVADTNNNNIRKIVMSTGEVTTLATGFNEPSGITIAGTNLYVVDTNNHTIRKIVIANGTVTTLVGPAAGSQDNDSTDGTGNAARFWGPIGITTDGTYLYVTEYSNSKVRRIE